MKITQQQLRALAESTANHINDKVRNRKRVIEEGEPSTILTTKELKAIEDIKKAANVLSFVNITFNNYNLFDETGLENLLDVKKHSNIDKILENEDLNLVSSSHVERELLIASIDSTDLESLKQNLAKRLNIEL